ncbi:MAG: tetratricopeptide repeat protein [Bdellovibrionales bacterium]
MNIRNTLSVAALALVLSLPLAACNNPEEKASGYLKNGNALFQQGQYDKARVEYKNALRILPAAADPRYRLGLVDEMQGDLRNAFNNFAMAEQQDTHFHPAKLKVAQYLLGAEQYDETEKRLNAVLSEDPDNAEAHAIRAALLIRRKDYDAAEKEAQIALSKSPTSITAFSALAGIYAAKQDYEKAIASINDGIAKNPKNLALLLLRTMLYDRMDDLPKLIESYRAVFELKPEEIRFRTSLAARLAKANKIDEAETILREGVTALPNNWDMKQLLVRFLNDKRGLESAEQEIKSIMQANSGKNEPYFWLADLYASHNAMDKASELLEQIVTRNQLEQPGLNARTRLAQINISRGNKELAEKLIGAVLAKDANNRAALMIRARMSFEKGAYQNVVSDLRTVLRETPNNAEALQILGEAYLMQGRLDLAIDTMKRLVEADSVSPAPRVRLAQMLHMNGNTPQAMELITQVTKTSPDYAIGWENAARLALDAKQWLPAQEAIQKLATFQDQRLTAVFLEGQLSEANGKPEEAIAKYQEVINENPSSSLAEHALPELVSAYKKLGRMEAASHYLETLKSDSPYLATILAESYMALNKSSEAAATLDKTLASSPPFQPPYLDRARLYQAENKLDAALDILEKGARAAPTDFRAPLLQAELLGNMGKHREAIAVYSDILERNPNLDVAANNLAEIIADYDYNDSASLDRARRAAERFSSATNPLLLDTLAWVYYRQGNYTQALPIMERAIAKGGPFPPQVHYHYGAILAKIGKPDLAKAQLQKATVDGAKYWGLEEAKMLLAELK